MTRDDNLTWDFIMKIGPCISPKLNSFTFKYVNLIKIFNYFKNIKILTYLSNHVFFKL